MDTQNNSAIAQTQQQTFMPIIDPQALCNPTNPDGSTWLQAYALASCNMVPKMLRPKRPGDIPSELFLALKFCENRKMTIFEFANDYCIIDAKITKNSARIIREIKEDKRFVGGPRFASVKDAAGNFQGIYCYTKDAQTGETIAGSKVTREMAQKFGWYRNPIWSNMETQMLIYRAAVFFARMYGVGNDGFRTADEVADIAVSDGRQLSKEDQETLANQLNDMNGASIEVELEPQNRNSATAAAPAAPQPEPVVTPIAKTEPQPTQATRPTYKRAF